MVCAVYGISHVLKTCNICVNPYHIDNILCNYLSSPFWWESNTLPHKRKNHRFIVICLTTRPYLVYIRLDIYDIPEKFRQKNTSYNFRRLNERQLSFEWEDFFCWKHWICSKAYKTIVKRMTVSKKVLISQHFLKTPFSCNYHTSQSCKDDSFLINSSFSF